MRQLICVLAIFIIAGVAIAQDIPTVNDLGVDQTIADAQNSLNAIPDPIDVNTVTNETATQLFSWMKWLFSENSARELVGNTLAPILINLYVMLGIVISYTVTWLAIRALVLLWRFIMWIASWIIKLIELIPFVQ